MIPFNPNQSFDPFSVQTVILPIICEKCGGKDVYRERRYYGQNPNRKSWNEKWCSGCNANILHDITEEFILSRKKGSCLYKFLGFTFEMSRIEVQDVEMIYLRLWKRLVHPEAPQLIYSFSSVAGVDLILNREETIAKAAAWLIAHWWEHALDICPCQNGVRDDKEGSSFRKYLIDILLWYHYKFRPIITA